MDDGSIASVIVQKSYVARFGLSTKVHSAAELANIKGLYGSFHRRSSTNRFIRQYHLARPDRGYSRIIASLSSSGKARSKEGIANRLSSQHHREGSFCFFKRVELNPYQGIVVQMTATKSIGQIYAGRIILGLAGGMGSVIGPTYLAEVAPKTVRGACGIFRGCALSILRLVLTC